MDIFGGHLPELIIVLVVILIIWGPGKLPDIGAAVGRGIREFRKASAETRDAMRAATADEPATPAEEPATPASPAQPADTEPAPTPTSGGSSGSGAS
jgi:TatA/E family protein of Tat protein translocase